jgi:hypothetical protein
MPSNGMSVEGATHLRERLNRLVKEEALDGVALAMISIGLMEQALLVGLAMGETPEALLKLAEDMMPMAERRKNLGEPWR